MLAHAVVDCGALETFVSNLEVFDADIKESAIWALNYSTLIVMVIFAYTSYSWKTQH